MEPDCYQPPKRIGPVEVNNVAESMIEPELVEISDADLEHLITEDDQPVDSIFSEKQMRLLTRSLYASWKRPAFVALANVGLFYSTSKQAVVPDVLVSVNVHFPEELGEKRHRSYFVWEYGKPPEMVIEVVSNRKGEELGAKRELYSEIGVAYYAVFDPFLHLGDGDLHLFERRGAAFLRMKRPWFPQLGLGLGLWEGSFEGIESVWLRWVDRAGDLLATGEEAAELAQALAEEERLRAEDERQRADDERRRAEDERRRNEKLAAQLRALGVEPEA